MEAAALGILVLCVLRGGHTTLVTVRRTKAEPDGGPLGLHPVPLTTPLGVHDNHRRLHNSRGYRRSTPPLSEA